MLRIVLFKFFSCLKSSLNLYLVLEDNALDLSMMLQICYDLDVEQNVRVDIVVDLPVMSWNPTRALGCFLEQET